MSMAVNLRSFVGTLSGPVDLCESSEFSAFSTCCSVTWICRSSEMCLSFVSPSGNTNVSVSKFVWDTKYSLHMLDFNSSFVTKSPLSVSNVSMSLWCCRPISDLSILWYVKGSRLLSISARAFVSMCSLRSRLLSAVTKFLCCLHLLHSALFVSSVLCLEFCPRCAVRFLILEMKILCWHLGRLYAWSRPVSHASHVWWAGQ